MGNGNTAAENDLAENSTSPPAECEEPSSGFNLKNCQDSSNKLVQDEQNQTVLVMQHDDSDRAEATFQSVEEVSSLKRKASDERREAGLQRTLSRRKSSLSNQSVRRSSGTAADTCAITVTITMDAEDSYSEDEDSCSEEEGSCSEEEEDDDIDPDDEICQTADMIQIEAPLVVYTKTNGDSEVWRNVSFFTDLVTLSPVEVSAKALKYDTYPCSQLQIVYYEDDEEEPEEKPPLRIEVDGETRWEADVSIFIEVDCGNLKAQTGSYTVQGTICITQQATKVYQEASAPEPPSLSDPDVMQRFELIKQLISECRAKKLDDGSHAIAAAYQPMAGGEAVVWLLIPVDGFGLGVDALSAWGLDPGEYISIRINMGLGSGKNLNGLTEVAASARFTRSDNGPPLVIPPPLHWCSIDSKEWKSRFLVQKCKSCKFVEQNQPLTGYPEAGLEKLIISKSIEDLLHQRLQFILDEEAKPNGMDEDTAILAAISAVTSSAQGDLIINAERVAACAIEAVEMNNRCIPMTFAMDSQHEEVAASKRNLFLRIGRFVQRRLLLCTRHCMIGTCYAHIDPILQGLKPMVCGKEICQKQASMRGGSVDLCAEIRRAPEVFDLLVSLTYMGAKGSLLMPFPKRISGSTPGPGKVYHGDGKTLYACGECGFPQTLRKGDSITLLEKVADGRIVPSNRIAVDQVVNNRELLMADRFGLAHTEDEACGFKINTSSLFVEMRDGVPVEKSERWDMILEALDRLPPVAELVQQLDTLSADAMDNFDMDVNTAFAQWLKATSGYDDDRLLNLLQYIVSTNRGHLRLLKPEEEIKHGVAGMHAAGKQYQFVMLCGNPDREKLFREAKLRCENDKGIGNGSVMGFHAGPTCVWNSIVRNGLEYRYMRNAQAYGSGVYLAQDQNYSNSPTYCGASDSWPNSALGTRNVKVMAVCEVVNRPEKFRSSNPFYVVQHVGDRDHPRWKQFEKKPLYESDPEFAGEDWVMAKVMLYGESGSSGDLCRNAKDIKVPDVSMTPQIAKGSSGLARMPSAIKTLVRGRSGGHVNRTEGSMDEGYRMHLQECLTCLINNGYAPHVALAALQDVDGDLKGAADLLKATGAVAER